MLVQENPTLQTAAETLYRLNTDERFRETCERFVRAENEMNAVVRRLVKKDAELAVKDAKLAEKDAELAEKDAELAEKDAALIESNEEITKLKAILKNNNIEV